VSPRNANQVVIWCSYFNEEIPLSKGRRIGKKHALKSPTLEMLTNAAKDAGFVFDVEADKAFPSQWWEKEGRIIVNRSRDHLSKTKIINQLAKQMRINEAKKPPQEKVSKEKVRYGKKHYKPKPKSPPKK